MEELEKKVKYYTKLIDIYGKDFFRWCYDILGYKDMNDEHRELCEFIIKKDNFKLILMPRYTFKSWICTVGWSLWNLMLDPNLRILIYSDASTKAEGFLATIKSHIEGKIERSEFRTYFPEGWETDPQKGKWSQSQIVIKPRFNAYPEPTIDTAGVGTTKVGFHYDIIIFDDIVSDINVTTKEQMDKVADCYKSSLSLLVPNGKVIMLGTRWHFGDLYGRIIAENEVNKTWNTLIKSAIEDNKYLFDNIGKSSLTKEFLTQRRLDQGAYKFSCLYMNSPVDDETAVFKARDFSFHGGVKSDDLYITATCDPAGKGEDKTAITVVGTDNNMDMHILDIINEKLQPSEIVDKIITLHTKYEFKMFGIETNFFRGMLKQELERRMRIEEVENPKFGTFGIEEFKPTSRKGENKHSRIRALQPYHERGSLKFPGERLELLTGVYSELGYQMLQFPHAAHDDILDSLAYHLPLIRKGGVVIKADLPKFSPAWLEEQSLKEELAGRSNLPRKLRGYVYPLSLS